MFTQVDIHNQNCKYLMRKLYHILTSNKCPALMSMCGLTGMLPPLLIEGRCVHVHVCINRYTTAPIECKMKEDVYMYMYVLTGILLPLLNV